MLKVDFVVRSDSEFKDGGDSEQVRQYVAGLDGMIDSRVAPFRADIEYRRDAIVHIVNIDRPFDFDWAFRAAANNRTVISPIHHRLSRIRLMRQHERGRGLRSAGDVLLPENAREWLASIVRESRSTGKMRAGRLGMGTLARAPQVWRQVGRQLDLADAVLLLADGEGRDISADTGWSGQNAVVLPNGRPRASGQERSWSDRDIPVLTVGRIEPRKRSAQIATAAHDGRVPLTMVGPIVDPSTKYARDFLDLVNASPHVRYLGPQKHGDVLDLMGRSKVLLNPSWVEVQSLVDLEGAFSGARVVSFPNGNSSEWLPDHVTEVPNFAVTELLEVARGQSRITGPPPIPAYDWDWGRVSKELMQVYEGLAT